MSSARAEPPSLHRCPACGQQVEPAHALQCPLCGFDFGNPQVTSDDATPYARAHALGQPGWRRMSEWVWFSGSERIKHVALMRASAASRRFARLNMILLATALAIMQGTRVGWKWVTLTPGGGTAKPPTPAGEGWFLVAATPPPLGTGAKVAMPVDLWWNPVQVIVAVCVAGFVAGLMTWLVLALVRSGVRLAHTRPYRKEQRMTAALHYSTAWTIPVSAAMIVGALIPISHLGTVERWSWCPNEQMFVLSAAVLASVGGIGWWFWLIRLGSAAAPRTRARVIAFWALGAPLIVAAMAACWWWGGNLLYDPLFEALNVQF